MLNRSTISRREPVIALETFRYRGRDYKEGDYLDRRRCRMPHSKLLRLLRKGVCILAKNMNPEKLAKYGFMYCPESPRLKLNRISTEDPAGDDSSPEPTLKHIGGGWYDVMINDKPVNDKGLRKDDAITFRDNYKAGE